MTIGSSLLNKLIDDELARVTDSQATKQIRGLRKSEHNGSRTEARGKSISLDSLAYPKMQGIGAADVLRPPTDCARHRRFRSDAGRVPRSLGFEGSSPSGSTR
jgi:hypothetical protein